MNVWHWILIVEFGVSALALTWRSASGSVRRYTAVDAIFGIPEMAFLIWIVVTRL